MSKQSCLILIKPDGLKKSLTGNIIAELSKAELKIIAAKIVSVDRELGEKHYQDLKQNKPEIFEEVLKYIMGEYHTRRVLALVYHGENAIQRIREIAGVTNPENANPISIRGRYGRINSQTNVLENCIHASDSEESSKREIQLWFFPNEIVKEIYPTKTKEIQTQVKVWE